MHVITSAHQGAQLSPLLCFRGPTRLYPPRPYNDHPLPCFLGRLFLWRTPTRKSTMASEEHGNRSHGADWRNSGKFSPHSSEGCKQFVYVLYIISRKCCQAYILVYKHVLMCKELATFCRINHICLGSEREQNSIGIICIMGYSLTPYFICLQSVNPFNDFLLQL